MKKLSLTLILLSISTITFAGAFLTEEQQRQQIQQRQQLQEMINIKQGELGRQQMQEGIRSTTSMQPQPSPYIESPSIKTYQELQQLQQLQQ